MTEANTFMALPHSQGSGDHYCVCHPSGMHFLADFVTDKATAEAIAAELNRAWADGEKHRARQIAALLEMDEG